MNINESKKEASIRRGVRQGCPLSPYLFNKFIEEAIREMKGKTKGIKVNGVNIHTILFADDIIVLADSENETNKMLIVLSKL